MCHTCVIIPGLPASLSPPTTFVDLTLETSQILRFISIVPPPQFSTSFLIGSLAVILPHSYPSSTCIKDGLGPGSQKAHLDPRGPCRAQPSACDMADNSVPWWSSAAVCQLRSADVSWVLCVAGPTCSLAPTFPCALSKCLWNSHSVPGPVLRARRASCPYLWGERQ